MSRSNGTKSTGRLPFLRPVLLAFSAVILVFVVYEVVERLWLQNVHLDTLHLIHRSRGLASSLIAAVLVGWLIVRSSPPLLSSTLTMEAWTRGDRPTQEERLVNYVRWFILMRWIAVLVAALLVFIVVRVAELLPLTVWWPLVSSVGVLAALNAGYTLALRARWRLHQLLPFQAYADLIILAALLHFSGGIENPLTILMIFHVIIAGTVLNRRHCYAVAATASCLIIVIAAGEATGLLHHYTLNIFPHFEDHGHLVHAAHQTHYVISYVGLLTAILFLTAYFVTTLAERVRHSDRQLEEFADQMLGQRQLMEKALETTDTGLCVCDRTAHPYWTNERWNSWFGRSCIDGVASSHQLPDEPPVRRTLIDGKMRVSEVSLHRVEQENKSHVFRVTTAPLLDKDGCVDHVVSLAQEITAQKETQAQIERAGKLAAVGELAGQVAHEVNNPIAIISAKCRLLLEDRRDEMSEKVAQEIGKVTELSDRVAQIARGLLSYYRPSTGTRCALNIVSSLRKAVAMIEQRAQSAGIEIEERLPAQLPTIHGNAGELQQVFLNILLNALDAMPDGGRLVITASEQTAGCCADTAGRLVIEVADTGTGVPPEIKDRIFEPFFTTKVDGKGTGLGLSICSGLIRSHDGAIYVDSEPGEGTRVVIHLPVHCMTEGEVADA